MRVVSGITNQRIATDKTIGTGDTAVACIGSDYRLLDVEAFFLRERFEVLVRLFVIDPTSIFLY